MCCNEEKPSSKFEEDSPDVSVVIPFFSRTDWLLEAVEALQNQTISNWEAIIVNDGSPEDDSEIVDVVSADSRIKYVRQENAGPAAARNYGIELSRGRYIAFLDSDDLWLSNKLKRQLDYMTSSGKIWSHTGYYRFVDGSEDIVPFSNKFEGSVYPKLLIRSSIATPCVMVVGSVLRNNPKLRFNNSMRYGQDSYLWVLLARDYELGYVNEKLTKVRMRGTNATRKAYAHLSYRAHLLELITPLGAPGFPLRARFAFHLCSFGACAIDHMKKKGMKDNTAELVSKALYVLPYVLLKSSREIK